MASATLVTLGTEAYASDSGFEELDAWQLESALSLAQEALKEDRDDPKALWLAARMQNARGHHLEALSILKNIEGIGEAYRTLIAGPSHYTSDSYLLESLHFKIRFRDKDEIVAYYAQEVLEQTYRRIGEESIFPSEGTEKIAVEIYPDARGLASNQPNNSAN